jgi:regulator of replication initiation timing
MENNENKQEDNLQQYAPKTESKSKMIIFIIVGVILMAVLVYFFMQNKSLKEEVVNTQFELNAAVLQLDSIGSELDKKIFEIQRLGGDIDTLLVVKAELEQEKRKLLTTNQTNKKSIAELKEKVSGYQELLLIKDKEIVQLKKQNEVLFTENTTLKVEKNQLKDSITSIGQTRDQLSQKVAIASELKIEGMRIFAVNEAGKEREAEFRNRHITNLRIDFNVAENKVAEIMGKNLLIRVIAPQTGVLFDVTRGSGTFNFEGREMFYTIKKDILYDRTKQKVSVLYDRGSEYDLGKYTVEVYTDEYLMGTGSFVVK